MSFFWIVAALGWGCTSAEPSSEKGVGCNGHEELCERPLDQVTLAGTHNSMSNEDEGWLAPNQGFGISRQLQDGIRAMMLDTVDVYQAVLMMITCLTSGEFLIYISLI